MQQQLFVSGCLGLVLMKWCRWMGDRPTTPTVDLHSATNWETNWWVPTPNCPSLLVAAWFTSGIVMIQLKKSPVINWHLYVSSNRLKLNTVITGCRSLMVPVPCFLSTFHGPVTSLAAGMFIPPWCLVTGRPYRQNPQGPPQSSRRDELTVASHRRFGGGSNIYT